MLTPSLMDWVSVGITTKSGKGPFLPKDPAIAVYKTLPVIYPKTFPQPEYRFNRSNGINSNATLFWDSNVTSDTLGKAKVSFSSGLKPGIYTVIVEGANMNGLIGYQKSKIIIE